MVYDANYYIYHLYTNWQDVVAARSEVTRIFPDRWVGTP